MGETDDESGWLTYSEAAAVLGSTAEAVRRRARRYNWPRLRPNLPGEPARVRVPKMPASARGCPPAPDEHSMVPDGHVPRVQTGTAQAGSDPARALETAIETLREQLEAERKRVDQLFVELADARMAAMISGCEAAALRTENVLLKTRPWWRRGFR